MSSVADADGNIVSANTASGNLGRAGDGGGVHVQASSGNQLSGNIANGNLDTGITVAEDTPGDASGNFLQHNTASRNRGAGSTPLPVRSTEAAIARAATPRRHRAGT